ncbi:MAG: hydantoinase B/oxoprolinase family protein [Bacillota bacterium]|nr:hydantoinase B/oxoprolinase family protein [Bacillota bacterium]
MEIDPFTREVVKAALEALGEQMFWSVARTSQSPIIYEVLDYATGLTDGEGNLITQGNGVTGFLGTVASAVKETILRYGKDLQPGDVIAGNDPYVGGGTHLSDVSLVMPYFVGGHILAFGAVKAHWPEVGGASAGSFAHDTPDIFAEGLQLPFVKLVEGGRLQEGLLKIIATNVRTPEATLGDFQAQWAALRQAGARLEELVAQYGEETLQAAMEDILRRGRAMALRALEELPKGVFQAEDFMDDDGFGRDPIPIRVRVTIDAKRFTVDFTGSSPAVKSSLNTTWAGLEAACRTAYRALLPPDYPANEGIFAPLEIICPPGTVFTAQRPTPVSTYWEASDHATDLILKALAEAIPHRLPAGHHLSVCGTILAGRHARTGEPFILVEPQAGGWGASRDLDGVHALVPVGDGDTYNIPAEVVEARYGLEVLELALDLRPGGAGRRRGGRGIRKTLRIPRGPVLLTATLGRHRIPPWGVAGGQPGTTNGVEIRRRDGTVSWKGKVAREVLDTGDEVTFRTGTGGGYGDPKAREEELLWEDLRDGYISVEEAVEMYGLPPAAVEDRMKEWGQSGMADRH